MTTETPKVVTYDIPEWNISLVESRLAKLNKRATKIGCEPLVLTTHSINNVPDPSYEGPKDRAPLIKVHTVSIDGDVPKIAGWKFVGTLDHTSLPGSVVVRTVPGEQVPSQYFHHDGTCDHCKKIRTRNETFVVENEARDFKAVGRNCLRDFLGHDPHAVIGFLNSLHQLIEDINEDRLGGSGGGRRERYFDLLQFLSQVAAVIRLDGWTPRSAADPESGKLSTASVVMHLFTPPSHGYTTVYDEWKRAVEHYRVTEEDTKVAENSVEWVKQKEPTNEFMHNLITIVNAEVVSHRLSGYAAAIVSSYLRETETLRLRESNLAAIKHEYVGQVKERIELDVIFKQFRYFDGAFGPVCMHEFRDTDGHVLVWFSSTGKLDYNVGDQFRIVGTVKQHKMYNDIHQTALTRVKVKE